MKLKGLFAAVASACLVAGTPHMAQALTPTLDDPAQVQMQEASAGFIRHMPYCCAAGEIRIGFETAATSNSGLEYDVAIDPKAYGIDSADLVTVHVDGRSGSWPKIITDKQAQEIEQKCLNDPAEQQKDGDKLRDMCRRPWESLVFAQPSGDGKAPGNWSVYCLLPKPSTF